MSRYAPLLAAAVLVAPRPALAWNSVGHMAVARLAYEQLDDGTKLRLAEILEKHPHYGEFLGKHRPGGVPAPEWAFLRAATWPDWVRPRGKPGQPDPRGERVTKYHRRDDHFINRPFVRPENAARFAERDLRPDPDMNTVISAYTQRVGELTLANTTDEDKAVALCWLLHLIGDIHQPLHAASQYSSLFPGKGGDLGGNLFGLKVEGRATNLHRFWDDLLGDDPNYLDDGGDRQVRIYNLAREAAEELRGAAFGRDTLKADLETNTTFPSWVDESFELAKSVAYQGGALKAVRVKDGQVPPEAEEAGKDYVDQARAVARKRAALAGHRTADKLKQLLARKPS